MNIAETSVIAHSVCPHDCPSTCALDIELFNGKRIGKVRGSPKQTYTAGVICAKVARYADRVHHPDRLLNPMRRVGAKGEGRFEAINWDDALDAIAEAFTKAEQAHGAESVWPYHYAGTMGHVHRDGIHRLAHAKGYSRQHDTICVNNAWTGFAAGTGKLAGPDPREIADADIVVIWGTNPVNTQVNVMTHAVKARKTRNAKIVVVDVYQTASMDQADLALCLRPGTDGALACAVMHILFRDGYADRDYMARYTDAPDELEAHLQGRNPNWAAAITGLSVEEIEAFAKLVGNNPRSYFRLGYGFTRSRNGTANMHAALCIPSVLGAWQYKGGGGFHSNGGLYQLDKTMVQGLDVMDPNSRWLDQSQIGPILTGDRDALRGGPPIHATIIQNTNPIAVAPEQTKVRQGFERGDFFSAIHEQFMTDTALYADIILPAAMFVEYDDVYTGGGHQYLTLGPKLMDPPGECRDNHWVICELAKRLGAEHPGFAMSPRDHIDWMLKAQNKGSIDEFEAGRWIDFQPDFATSHYSDGFAWPDRKFRFKADWQTLTTANTPPDGSRLGPVAQMPSLPDHWDVIESGNKKFPYRLATSPARGFLNTTFTEIPKSYEREGYPAVLMHPGDAERNGIKAGDLVEIYNDRGAVCLHAEISDGLLQGTVISEGIWQPSTFVNGKGINTLIGADSTAPFGGAAFHDCHVAIRLFEKAGTD